MNEAETPADFTAAMNACQRAPFADAFAAHYPHLRRITARLMARERGSPTLQPTALVHEAYLRLVDDTRVTAHGTVFFKACFARECRRILVDHARAQRAEKRGGGARGVTIHSSAAYLGIGSDLDLVELDDLIEGLGRVDERLAAVVEMRLLGGLAVAECAAALAVSERTVAVEWRLACTWMRRQLGIRAAEGA